MLKTPRILTFKFLGALKNQMILDDPEHAPEFIPRVFDISGKSTFSKTKDFEVDITPPIINSINYTIIDILLD